MAVTDDPAYQAYLRALGFDQDLATKDAALKKAQAVGSAQLAKPEILAQGGETREGISDSYEDRGMFLGSERLRDLAAQQRGEQYQLALIDKSQADAVANIGMGLQRELAGINKARIASQPAAGSVTFDPVAEAMALVGIGKQTAQSSLPRTPNRPTRTQGLD